MIPSYLMPLANHLWQSTVFLAVVAALCRLLRRQRASLRFLLWFTASLRFLLPAQYLSSAIAAALSAAKPASGLTIAIASARDLSHPFHLAAPSPMLSAVPPAGSFLPQMLFALWACGFAMSAAGWAREWLRIGRIARRASPAIENGVNASLDVRITTESLEPCVFGIFHPVLLLPEVLSANVTEEQRHAILLHEIEHVRRRDNLAAAIHALTQAILWFFPPVNLIGSRLLRERETACDEAVLRAFAKPETYARGILAVCRLTNRVAPSSAAGVTGRDLKTRVAEIMRAREIPMLSRTRRLLITLALAVAAGTPLWIGILTVRQALAQPQNAANAAPFSVASIRPAKGDTPNRGFRRSEGGELNTVNITVRMLIAFAYDIPDDRILRGPAWIDSDGFDILARPERVPGTPFDSSRNAIRTRTQALLAERFGLALHKETRQLTIYTLVVDKGGPKDLHPASGGEPDWVNNGRHLDCTSVAMTDFARGFLTSELKTPVVDETGIAGTFNFSLDWMPDETTARHAAPNDTGLAADPNAPSIFTALREQLGLRLESVKGPVEVIVVDRVTKPSAN